jgi:hypothetical protein
MGVWNLTLRLTDVTGYGCAAETMQSRLGEPNRYSLSVKQAGANTVDVTLTSASGDYSCTFTNSVADGSGFRTVLGESNPTCAGGDVRRDFRCGDRTLDLLMWGQRISARVSGIEISGEWRAGFSDAPVYFETTLAETQAEFTGSR